MSIRIAAYGLAGVAATLVAGSGEAKTYYATAANIYTVWANVHSGDTLRLSGNFGFTNLRDKVSTAPIVIDARKASFTNTLRLDNINGLKVYGGIFGSATRTTRYGKAVVVYNGANINFDKSYMVGAHGGTGIEFDRGTNLSVINGTFTTLGVGAALVSVSGGLLDKNKSVGSVTDGFRSVDNHNVLISHNSCTSGNPLPGAHPDCVQLWSIRGKPPQSDIKITNNVAIGPTQGFTSFNASDGGGLRITMTGNRVDSSYPQGIACYACVDSNISYNTVTTIPGSRYMTNINVIGGRNNIVEHNSIGPKYAVKHNLAAVQFANVSDSFTTFDASATSSRQTFVRQAGVDATGAIPEPGVWAMLLAGFGLVGGAMRRRTSKVVAV